MPFLVMLRVKSFYKHSFTTGLLAISLLKDWDGFVASQCMMCFYAFAEYGGVLKARRSLVAVLCADRWFFFTATGGAHFCVAGAAFQGPQ